MIFKQVEWQEHGYPEYDWEEIPSEELWEDGEINLSEVQDKVIFRVLDRGDWILVRRFDNGKA